MNQPIHTAPKRFNPNFIMGSLLTAVLGLFLVFYSSLVGKIPFFLLLNNDLGKTADFFFEYWTNLGDGVVWIPALLLVYFFRRNKLPLLVAVFLISTFFTQLCKYYIFPAEPRPIKAIPDITQIHTVPGVEMHTIYSFPSGHTATAFCIFLMTTLLIGSPWVLFAGFAYAVSVGYSRIYLGQHFPLDVGGGMLIAILTVYLSQLIQLRWDNRSLPKKAADV
ncbi:MAG: phosphatase PAP2 family protein [Bacteroidota bacterium]|nr:phosphatase PAP2 family protein [Bacteroidota bacterium]